MIPADITSFYSKTNKAILLQGDIISAEKVGIKEDNPLSPDYWIIISKSCDLSFRKGQNIISRGGANLLPLLSFKLLKQLFKRDLEKITKGIKGKVVLLPLVDFSKATNSIVNVEQIDALIKDDLSKFMFIPPDGEILKEPVIVDFDLVERLDGSNEEETQLILDSKVLQLATPFKEKLAQRFALHYMSIGIDDDEIRDKGYKTKLKEYYKSIKSK
jgi:hypothetical protein